jgi:signal transduction histidine kinase
MPNARAARALDIPRTTLTKAKRLACCDRMPRAAVQIAGSLALLALLAAAVPANPSVAVSDPRVGEAVRVVFDVLEDPAGAWSAAEVARPPLSTAFHRVPDGVLNLGDTSSVYWVRFALQDRGGGEPLIVSLPSTIEQAELFVDDEPVASRAGKLVAFDDREVQDRTTSFRIRLARGATARLVLRLRSSDVMMIAPVLRSEASFRAAANTESLVFGAYYGLLLAMVVYNLIVFLVLRDAVYLYYVAFQVAFGAMVASFDQLLLQYLWPAHPAWSAHSELVFGCVTMSAGVMFARAFLDAPRRIPRTSRVMRASAVATLVLAAIAAVVVHPWLGLVARLAATYQCLLLLWAIASACRAGARDAPILAIAWLVFLGSALITAVSGLGIAPAFYAGPYALKLGSATEAMLLGLGLAHRIKRARQDEQRAQAELLAHRAEQAVLLEATVAERTQKLSAALHSLEATQHQMITQARLAALGNLIAGIAHEIGNPLNFSIGGAAEVGRRLAAIESMLERLRPMVDGDPRVAREIAVAEPTLRASRRAAQLIDAGNARIKQLVDALRGQLGGPTPVPRPIDLIAELDQVLTLIEARTDQQRITIVKQLPRLPLLECLPGELGQVFLNLLLNSCAAMPDGGEIRITGELRRGAVELCFTDTGPGIPAEHRGAVFDPFFTTRPPGEGTGLGLAISYDIVRRHGGELVLADGEPGAGAAFVVRLPIPA